MEIAGELLPAVFLLIDAHMVFIKSSLLSQLEVMPASDPPLSMEATVSLCSAVLSISSSKVAKGSIQRPNLINRLPCANIFERWTANTANEFPNVGAWVSPL